MNTISTPTTSIATDHIAALEARIAKLSNGSDASSPLREEDKASLISSLPCATKEEYLDFIAAWKNVVRAGEAARRRGEWRPQAHEMNFLYILRRAGKIWAASEYASARLAQQGAVTAG